MTAEEDREVAEQMALLDLADRHPYSRYGCEEPGCPAVYEHPRILASLGSPWRCPDHDPNDPRRITQ